MLPRVPPYPPPPRHAPADLGRRLEAPPVLRAVGIAAHLLGVALFAAAPLAAAWAAVAFLLGDETPLIVRMAGFVVCTVAAFVYLKSLLPRRLRLPPAVVPVLPDHEPTAYAFVRRVADDLAVPAPRRLFVGSGTELHLGGRRSLGWSRARRAGRTPRVGPADPIIGAPAVARRSRSRRLAVGQLGRGPGRRQ
jgi:hypothetical protein